MTMRATHHLNTAPAYQSALSPIPVDHSRRDVHPRFTINWAATTTALVALVMGLLIGLYVGASLVMHGAQSGVPVCTDQIADAGGVCIGEPR